MGYFNTPAFGRIIGVFLLILLTHAMRIVGEQKARHRMENWDAYLAKEARRQLKIVRYQAWRNAKLRALWYWLTRPLSGLRPRKAIDLIPANGSKGLWNVVYRSGRVTVERRLN